VSVPASRRGLNDLGGSERCKSWVKQENNELAVHVRDGPGEESEGEKKEAHKTGAGSNVLKTKGTGRSSCGSWKGSISSQHVWGHQHYSEVDEIAGLANQ